MTVTSINAAPSRRKRKPTQHTIAEVDRHMSSASRLQAQIQELEKQLLVERVWLLKHMIKNDELHLQLGDFNVYRRVRHSWSYSPHLERELLKIRHDQKYEQTEGIAKDKPTNYVSLQFRQSKD